MKLYRNYIFPLIYDYFLTNKHLHACRKKLLSNAHGKILEIGIGTGQNLIYYPSSINSLWGLDPNPGMHKQLVKKLKLSPLELQYHQGYCEKLPYDNDCYDCVISTLVLCSVSEISQSLQEIRRVLKPQGKFLFLEHGKSSEERLYKRQVALSPYWKYVGDGCQLHIDMEFEIKKVFSTVNLEKFYLEKAPKTLASMYLGQAS